MDVDRAVELYELADVRAAEFAAEVSRAAGASRSEREFQAAVDSLLAKFAADAGVGLLFRGEYTLATGRADAVYNRLVIEYEAPGSLRPSLGHARTAHAVKQVKDYIDGLARQERHERAKLLGAAFDGSLLVFVRWYEGTWHVEPARLWDVTAAARLLRSLVSLSSGRALTPNNLVEDFGSDNLYTQRATRALYQALEGHVHDLAGMMFRQWRLFFSEVSGYDAAAAQLGQKKQLQQFTRGMGLRAEGIDLPRLFFAIHTYFSFLAKAIATLVLERYAGGRLAARPLAALARLDKQALRDELARIEDGGLFRDLGLVNLLEGDFFSWYLHAWTPEVGDALQLTLRRLAEYNPATIEEDPFAARDLLKMLYHRLLPREIRHDLGEYYTPDWLAARLLRQLGEPLFVLPDEHTPSVDFNRRLLDPACGSGTFLVLAIRAIKEHARRTGVSPANTLDIVLRNVVGIDLNPLAVLAARVGYLLAVADLLPFRRDEVAIPVYLADSIVTPTTGASLFEQGRRLHTVVGSFPVPECVTSAEAISTLADVLHEYVQDGRSADQFVSRIREQLVIDEQDEATLRELFGLTSSLKRDGRNGIWARIVKNAFMPLFIGRFDYVAGNPPWVNWENLPDGYRQQTASLWESYGLFVHRGMDTILGKGKKDISTLMTYVAADRYLASGGRLGFVITQSVFKTAGAGQGFRRFTLPGLEPLRVVHVDDMSELRPFEGAANRTSVLILQKGRPTVYPVPYTYWRKTSRGQGLRYDSTLEMVIAMTARMNLRAEPVDSADPTSAWLTARPAVLRAVRNVLGRSDYQAHAGAYTGGANGVYWLEVLERRSNGLLLVRNITEGAKRAVEDVTAELEADLVYPLLRPRDLARWQAEPTAHILLVQDPEKRRGIDEKTLTERFPRTYKYLTRFKPVLAERRDRGTRQIIEHGGPFYSMFGIGDYTLSPFKVVWSRIASDVQAAVLDRDVVPQETITLVPTASRDEANYVCALLNSLPFRCAAIAYSQAGGKSFGSPHLLENLRVPSYDAAHPLHRRLAALASSAASEQESGRAATETDIDQAAAELWGVDARELAEMAQGLREVQQQAEPRDSDVDEAADA
jgi:SAM-dependent methyltransferase